MSETRTIQITSGDSLHTYGSIGAMDYTVRLVRQMCLQTPTLEARKAAFGQSLAKGENLFTFMVSYVGQWKYETLGKHIVEFWTHVPPANNFLVEIAAVNGNIFLSFHQRFMEDKYYDVKVKSQEKALSLVSMHKQPQDHCERPVLGRWFLAPLVPLPARIERERVQGVCAY